MKGKKFARVVLAACIGGSAALLAQPPSAFADPTGCNHTSGPGTVTAQCFNNAPGTQYRAGALCRYVTPSGSVDNYYAYGPWRNKGYSGTSVASCIPGGVVTGWAETR